MVVMGVVAGGMAVWGLVVGGVVVGAYAESFRSIALFSVDL